MKNIKTIIFDYDGTIHNSIKIYAPAFRKCYEYLVSKGLAKEKAWTDKEISKWLGYSSKDMWNSFMPELKEEEKLICSSIIGNEMKEYILKGSTELYSGSLEVLQYLKDKGYKLIFLSNCKIEYMNAHNEIFKLDKYFDELFCTEQFDFLPKYEIFKVISLKYSPNFLVVGDRFQDIEIAKKHGLYSIGCSYGYGSEQELRDADIIINDISEMINEL